MSDKLREALEALAKTWSDYDCEESIEIGEAAEALYSLLASHPPEAVKWDGKERRKSDEAGKMREWFGHGVSWGISYNAADRNNIGVCEAQIDDAFNQLQAEALKRCPPKGEEK